MGTRLGDRAVIRANDAALALVDDALQGLTHRELVTTDEARACLHEIAAEVDDPLLAVSALSLVEEAVASYDESLLVGGRTVVDTLLDLRLALTD